MAKIIPSWIIERYSVLWKKFQNSEITYEDIKKPLSLDDRNTISVFLNELRKAGWLEVKLSKEDIRKRIYTLRPCEEVMGEIITNANKDYKNRISR